MSKYSRWSHVSYRAAPWCALRAIVVLAAIVLAGLSLSPAMLAANDSSTEQFLLNRPKAVAVDRIGNLYIADSGNNRILLCSRSGQSRVILERPLRGPCGLAVDVAGNLYIADTGNDRVLRRTPDGTVTILVAGFLRRPTGLDVDAVGNLYIADTENDRILCRTLRGEVCVVRTDPFTLNRPMGVVVGPLGLCIADTGNNRILCRPPGCDPSIVRVVSTFTLNQPAGLDADASSLYISDTCNNRILRVEAAGTTVVAGSGPTGCGNGEFSGDGGPAILARLNAPQDVAVLFGGSILIADTGNHRIRVVTNDGIINTVVCQ